jgi:hypothetical protein
LADVAGDADGVCTRSSDVDRRRLYLRLIEIEQGDTGAVRRKEFCGRLADAALAAGSRNDGDTPLEQGTDAMPVRIAMTEGPGEDDVMA